MANPIPLICPPLKTTNDVDFGPSIRNAISNTFGENPESYSEEIQTLNRCRQDALRGGATGTTGRDLLYKYFGQLDMLELRFTDLRIPFPWNDAFTSKHISQHSLAYEKASVIFNMGASLASLGSQQSRSSPEGLKRAFKFFQTSTCMYQYIYDTFLHAPSDDLGPEVVNILIQIMTAQATEIFYERMEEENKGESLKARTCAQIASIYNGLIETVRDLCSRGALPRLWNFLIQAKAKYYSSLCQFHRAHVDASSDKHGDSVARLKLAESLASEAQRYSNSFTNVFNGQTSSTFAPDAPTTLSNCLKNYQSKVTQEMTDVEKDNDFIYHQAVPTESALPNVEKINAVDPIRIQDVYNTPEMLKIIGPDIFQRLIPLSVHESASLYSEEKAKLARSESERCEVADNELASFLEHLGLPGSLAKFRSSSGNSADPVETLADPGPQVKSWAENIRTSETEDEPLTQMFEKLKTLRDTNASNIESATRQLDVESYECEQARVKHGHQFNQDPSSSHTKNFRSDLKSHREAMEKAKQADLQAEEDYNSIKDDIAIIGANDDGESITNYFASALPAAASANDSSSTNLLDIDISESNDDDPASFQKSINAIDDAYSRLQRIKKERAELLKDLRERIQSDDISRLLIFSRKGQNTESALFANELEKFRPHQGKISATLHYQQIASRELENNFNAIVQSPKGKEIQSKWSKIEKKRKELVARFRRVNELYNEVRRLLGMGLQFYKDLDGIVTNLLSEVKEFVNTRNAERARIENDLNIKQRFSDSPSQPTSPLAQKQQPGLEGSFGSLNISSPSPTSTSPPPVPPAPHRSVSQTSAMSSPSTTTAPNPYSPITAHHGNLPPPPPPHPQQSYQQFSNYSQPPPPPPNPQQQYSHPQYQPPQTQPNPPYQQQQSQQTNALPQPPPQNGPPGQQMQQQPQQPQQPLHPQQQQQQPYPYPNPPPPPHQPMQYMSTYKPSVSQSQSQPSPQPQQTSLPAPPQPFQTSLPPPPVPTTFSSSYVAPVANTQPTRTNSYDPYDPYAPRQTPVNPPQSQQQQPPHHY